MRHFNRYPPRQSVAIIEKPVETLGGCRHHWKIEAANGPFSKGVCKFCGAVQEFQNSHINSR